MDRLRACEARAAGIHWNVLEHIQLQWARKDGPRYMTTGVSGGIAR